MYPTPVGRNITGVELCEGAPTGAERSAPIISDVGLLSELVPQLEPVLGRVRFVYMLLIGGSHVGAPLFQSFRSFLPRSRARCSWM